MKNILYFFLLAFVVALVFSCAKDEAEFTMADKETMEVRKPAPKVDVCHFDQETGEYHTINISMNAWPAHEAHGDYMGECVTTNCEGSLCEYLPEVDLTDPYYGYYYCWYDYEDEYYQYAFLDLFVDDYPEYYLSAYGSWEQDEYFGYEYGYLYYDFYNYVTGDYESFYVECPYMVPCADIYSFMSALAGMADDAGYYNDCGAPLANAEEMPERVIAAKKSLETGEFNLKPIPDRIPEDVRKKFEEERAKIKN